MPRLRRLTSTRARARDVYRLGCLCAFLIAAAAAAAHAATPLAGSAIDNRAQANAAGSISTPTASNLVRAIVQSLYAWALAPDRVDTLAAGATASLAHRLTNAGNGPADSRLDLANLPGDDFDLTGLSLVHDLNGNNVADPGEPTIPPGGTLSLPAGGSADLLAEATVPAGAPASARAWLRLNATGVGSGAMVSSTDTLVVRPTASAGAALFVELTAARGAVEIGDDLDYTIRVANRSDTSFSAVTVTHRLPLGFAYLPVSARRDGTPIVDPAGGRGPRLAFDLGALGPNATATLRVRVRVTPAARDGDGSSRGWAAGGEVISNIASTRVAVGAGPFADEGTIVGTVFVDRNGDRRRGHAEPGLPGVRLYLDDGTFAVTDVDGQFSFYGLPPRTHALKADATTLPLHGRLVSVEHRQGEGTGVRFVDLHYGDLQRADFALAPEPRRPVPSPRDSALADSALIAEVRARADRLRESPDELSRGLRRELPTATPAPAEGELRGRPAAGVMDDAAPGALLAAAVPSDAPASDGPGAADGLSPVAGWPHRASGDSATSPRVEPPAPGAGLAIPLEDLLPRLDPTLGFVGLADGDTARGRQIAVAVKGPRGYLLELRVNGKPLASDRVGRRVTVADRALEVWEYVGVALNPGPNHLELAQRAGSGRVLGGVAVRLFAPGPLARLALVAAKSAPADGQGELHVRVLALDALGLPVCERTFVTLETTLGHWVADDLDPVRPGLQIGVEGGEAVVALAAPGAPGEARISAVAAAPATPALQAERAIAFVPGLRPLLAVGMAEGTVALRDLLRGDPREALARRPTGFETPIEAFASQADRVEAGARAAMFVKGRLKGAVQLTAGFDSERAPGTRRFRDIQPDAFYPIYGDAALRGYEAQSTGRLYARVDRHGASLLYGDFVTQGLGGARTLSAYSRTLTGVQQRVETGRFRIESFGSRERGRRQVDELAARGISGPYAITTLPMVENSEQVEIVVRDRNQPSVVLSAEPRQRFVDYTLETATGRLLFSGPVPSMDAQLNPVSIRVSYEVLGGAAAFWVAGGEARVQPTRRLELGGSWVEDRDPAAPYGLRSAFAGAKLGATTTLEAELARSDRAGAGSGEGARVELRHQGTRAAGRLFGAVTDAGFVNPGGGFGAGRAEAGGRYSLRVAEHTRLLTEGLFTSDAIAGDRRGGVLVAVDQGLTATTRGELGVRVAGGRRAGGNADPTGVALRGKLLAQLPRRPELSGYAELEQDVRESSRRMAAVGGEYRFSTRGRLYARHELLSSLTNVYALGPGERRLATVVGLDTDVASEVHVFSEYRLADVLAGREAEAAIGLRNAWRVDGWRVSTSFERVSPLEGAGAGPVTAVTGALETATATDTRASARMEFRTGRANDSFLSTIGLASRLDPAWTLLGRSITSISDERSRGVQVRMRLQLGMAYRRHDGEHWDLLSRYELHVDRESSLPLSRRARSANVVSVHGTGRGFDLLTASLSWAGKLVREESDGLPSFSGAHRVHARLSRDFARHWDVGVNGSGLWGDASRSRRHGLGLELGRKLQRDVWLSTGWNHFGYRDPDLPEEEWTEAGLYLRLRAKFDEALLRSLGMAP